MDATVIKVGGSLAVYPEKLLKLCNKLSELSKKHSLVIVPGGGEFADVVRDFDKQYSLSPVIAHRMAILGMDQYGFLLSQVIANSLVAQDFGGINKELNLGKLPIFLPSNFMFKEDPLENSWDVTSDSIALYVAQRLMAKRVILVTDVDGVYANDPKKHSEAKLLSILNVQQLLQMNMRTSVDKFLPRLLLEGQVACYVVNGQFPERVESILNGKETVCTLIEPCLKGKKK